MEEVNFRKTHQMSTGKRSTVCKQDEKNGASGGHCQKPGKVQNNFGTYLKGVDQ